MKTKTLIIFCVALLLGLLFALNRSFFKHDSSVEAAYDASVKNIGGMLSAIHSNLSAKNCGITNTEVSVSLNLTISFDEKKERRPFVLFDPWGNELLVSVLSNQYIKIVALRKNLWVPVDLNRRIRLSFFLLPTQRRTNKTGCA
jgi:hypothetical protein